MLDVVNLAAYFFSHLMHSMLFFSIRFTECVFAILGEFFTFQSLICRCYFLYISLHLSCGQLIFCLFVLKFRFQLT